MIELLTVTAIIIVLAGLVFGVSGSVQESARKAQAKSDLLQLVTAVKAYYAEYGHYPLTSPQLQAAGNGTGNTVFGDPDGTYSSADLCNILRAVSDNNYNQNNQLNPRQIKFLQGNDAKDATNPRGGFATADAKGTAGNIKKGSYVDPWGAEYIIFIDGSYQENVSVNGGLQWFYYNPSAPSVPQGVVGVSLGKDHSWGTNGNGKFVGSDDIATWQ